MSYNILVVDDSNIDRLIVKNMLEGYNTFLANNGKEALMFLEENTKIDLIILDLNMPVMNGFEVLKALQSEEKYKDIKTIILTNYDEIENEIKGLKLGAVDYIRKPINIDSLKARISVHLKILKMERQLKEKLVLTNEELANNYKILERINKELQIANEVKTAFLSRVSHELRTPMNGILGGSNLLLKSNDLNQIKEYAKVIEESANRLMPVIDDILHISEMDKNISLLKEDNIDIEAFITEIINSKQKLIKNKPINYIYNNNIDSLIWVKTNKKNIFQILNNVLNNAIKYTKEGKIEITTKIEDLENNKLNLKIEVKDTGIGIRKENYNKIFEHFEQEEKYLTRKHQGLGVGLSISKDLVEKMGGTIDFKSEEGKGTTFYFNIILDRINETEDSFSMLE